MTVYHRRYWCCHCFCCCSFLESLEVTFRIGHHHHYHRLRDDLYPQGVFITAPIVGHHYPFACVWPYDRVVLSCVASTSLFPFVGLYSNNFPTAGCICRRALRLFLSISLRLCRHDPLALAPWQLYSLLFPFPLLLVVRSHRTVSLPSIGGVVVCLVEHFIHLRGWCLSPPEP